MPVLAVTSTAALLPAVGAKRRLESGSYGPGIDGGFSPYRLHDANGEEITTVNEFLDAICTRGLVMGTVRTYGFNLLLFSENTP